jgi:hypothetical protein
MHVEIYTIRGRQYKYQVTNYRSGKKIKHKKKYLGPVKPVNKIQRKAGGGRKPSVFARAITSEERVELESAARANNAFAKERAKTILLSNQGRAVKEICVQNSKEKRSVLAAIHAFNTNRVACLKQGKQSGRKPVFSLEQRALIVQTVNTEPRVLGLNFTSWSLHKLRDYAVENNFITSISIEQLRQILLHGNKKFKKSRKWCYSNDPDFAKKNLLLTP